MSLLTLECAWPFEKVFGGGWKSYCVRKWNSGEGPTVCGARAGEKVFVGHIL
jgi:hypothetical protein